MALRLKRFSKRSKSQQLDLFGDDEVPAKTISKTVAQTPDKPASPERSRSLPVKPVAQLIARPGSTLWADKTEVERARTVFGTSRGDAWALNMYRVRQSLLASLREPVVCNTMEPAESSPVKVCADNEVMVEDNLPKCVVCGGSRTDLHIESYSYRGSIHKSCMKVIAASEAEKVRIWLATGVRS